MLWATPALRTAVIRSLVIVSGATAPGACAVYLGTVAGGLMVAHVSLGNYETWDGISELCLNPSDVLRASVTAGTVYIAGYGSLLNGAPE